MSYLVFDIGCIECGEDSAVVGVYRTEAAAKAAADKAREQHEANWRGQHSFEIFELPEETP